MKLAEFTKSLKGIGGDVMVLSAGIVIAQLIPLLLQPFLKRTFSPEDFGTYDVYIKTFSILVALSSFKYENAILLPKKDTDSKHVLYLSLLITIVIFAILIFIVAFFHSHVLDYLDGMTFFSLIILPFSVLSYTIFNVFNMYLIRRQKFVLSSSSKISRRFSEGIIQVLYGFFGNSKGLLVGDLIGNLVQGGFSFWKAHKITSFKYVKYSKLKQIALEYKELPIYTLIPNILNTFVLGSLTFLILDKFDLKEVGYIEFAQKILSIPSIFISIAISQVVFQRVSQLIIKKKKIIPLLWSVISILILISILLIVVVKLFAVDLFLLIGGDGWENSGKYAEILVFASAIMLIFSPLGKVLIALKKFKINSLWEICKFVVILSLFYKDGLPIEEYLYQYAYIIIAFYLIYGVTILYYSYKYQIENQVTA